MTDYDDAIALRPDGSTWVGELSDDWAIGEAVNGGLLMAMATTAVSSTSQAQGGHADPLSFSGVFLSPGAAGPVTVEPQILRTGRRMTTAQVRVTQDQDGQEVERLRALLTLGDLATYAEPVRKTLAAPSIPAAEECVSAREAPPSALTKSGFLQRWDLRMDPATVGWAVGRPSGAGLMRGWLRLADERDFDAVSLLLALDAFPPVAFDLGSSGWVPTVEFTGYVRGIPAPGWLQVTLSATHVAGGLLNEDCDIWDSTGRLVAHSRQLASARFAD
ncbi:thioesterase family protein [Rudaeicoccus suwonensis]|uniref:Acyl-CoA thioesterase n=1 Tax=Rudaeicoccus suwonensis TaxID=657409 RepID=A0A561EA91_9MICO|nr:thioesterase family protein [Rudaeicoccus suwonensis]TWE12500.1 acyl-CoA thioesterase [Rudaeicoccus suwonensis]